MKYIAIIDKSTFDLIGIIYADISRFKYGLYDFRDVFLIGIIRVDMLDNNICLIYGKEGIGEMQEYRTNIKNNLYTIIREKIWVEKVF